LDEPRHRSLGEGAAQAAPTAPHATPRSPQTRRNGPELFWARWPVRVALGLCLIVSGAAHCAVMPFDAPQAIEVHDYEGEAAIPIDVIEQGESPLAALEPPPSPTESKPPEADKSKDPSSIFPHVDAGVAREAGTTDAAVDAPADALSDAVAPSVDGAIPLTGVAGDGGSEPTPDPQSLLASSGVLRAKVIYVTLVINAIEIRKNPIGPQLGALLRDIPQWDEFMHGTEGLIDPVRDTDWIVISGPSLRDTRMDAVTLHYATSDANVDKAIGIVASHYDRGGSYDAGVPGARAWLAHADRAERVILRPRPRVLVIVPPEQATAVARDVQRAKEPKTNIMPGVATYLRIVDPHHALPGLVPEAVTQLTLEVRPREDHGADVQIEGQCKDETSAAGAADEVRKTIRSTNSAWVALGTGGLLDNVDVASEGAVVRVHAVASRAQLEKTLASVELFLPPPVSPVPSASHR